jgi:hypothetical protein
VGKGSSFVRLGCSALVALAVVAGAQAAAPERVDLVLRLSGPPSALAGDTVEYTVRAALKAGPAQRSVRLTATLPRSLEDVRFVPASGRYDRRTGMWRGVLLARGKPLLLRVRARVSKAAPAGPSRLSVRLTPRTGVVEIARRDNARAVTTDVRRPAPSSDVRVAVDDGRAESPAGSTASYVVTVANGGPDPVRGARVRLTLPAALEDVAVAAPPVGVYDGTSATWSGIDLAAGASATLRFTATVRGAVGTEVRVVVAVDGTGTSSDPDPANDTAADRTSVIAAIAPAPGPGPVPVPGPPPPPAP